MSNTQMLCSSFSSLDTAASIHKPQADHDSDIESNGAEYDRDTEYDSVIDTEFDSDIEYDSDIDTESDSDSEYYDGSSELFQNATSLLQTASSTDDSISASFNHQITKPAVQNNIPISTLCNSSKKKSTLNMNAKEFSPRSKTCTIHNNVLAPINIVHYQCPSNPSGGVFQGDKRSCTYQASTWKTDC